LRDEDGKCLVAIATISSQQLVKYGFEKNPGHGFQGFPVIGQPQARELLPLRPTREGTPVLRRLGWDSNPAGFCGLDVYTGFYIRFVYLHSIFVVR
jgi:hypothetical protein